MPPTQTNGGAALENGAAASTRAGFSQTEMVVPAGTVPSAIVRSF
jgi:hypothetical protein